MKGFAYGTLGDLCDVTIGRTPRRSDHRYWGGPHPWATIRDLDGKTLMSTTEGITDEALHEVMPKPVEPGTLLFSFKLTIGKMAFAGRRMHYNEAIAALPIRNPSILDREFLYYALSAGTHDQGTNHAVLGKVLNKRKVQEIKVPLPPLSEQRRIAGILNRAAKIERLRKQAQELMREFIPALFVKMFGDPAANPMGYPICALHELCVADRQGPYSNDPTASRVPFVGVENVESHTGTINFDKDSRPGSQKSTTFRFDERHVLYAKLRPYLNKVATPNFAGRCSTELVPLLPRKRISDVLTSLI